MTSFLIWVVVGLAVTILLWRRLRRRRPEPQSLSEIEQMFARAEKEGLRVTRTEVTSDIEEMAESLIADSLPRTFFDQIDISTDEGKARLLVALVTRRRKASLERDEIVRFAERNRAELDGKGMEIIKAFSHAAANVEGGETFGKFIDYFLEAARHAYEGHPEKINVKSDRLLWLLYASGLALAGDKICYAEVMAVLRKPENLRRISPLSLQFMLFDFVETMGQPQETHPEYAMLIVECALLSADVTSARAGTMLLGKLPLPRDRGALIDLQRRVAEFLKGRGTADDDLKRDADRISERFGRIADSDL